MNPIEFAAICLFGLFFYFAPWLNAIVKHHPRKDTIFWLNFLAGWSVIGWIGAFVWSTMAPPPEARQVVNPHPDLEEITFTGRRAH